MKLLAVDTSSIACSVALEVGDIVLERHEVRAREHTRLVVPMIRSVLDEGQCKLDSLDAIVLGNGPGSFIGMRIATALVQGMAHGAGLRVAPVSSLLAVAEQVFQEADASEVIVAQDAHMNEVYLGRFGLDGDVVRPLAAEILQAQERLTLDASEARVAAGAGWDRYPALWDENADLFIERSDIDVPTARFLFPAAKRQLQHGELLDPADVVPAYLRQQVASPPKQP